MAALTLDKIPGFADLPNASLIAGNVALGSHLAKISDNAALGMMRLERFPGLYKNGDTVPLPVSAVDGYTYTRAELLYVWGIQTSLNPDTGWITGPDALWYAGWKVDQTTGLVSTEEWYRRSGSSDQAASSNDGVLRVWTLGQRQRTNLTLINQALAYTDVDPAALTTDAADTQAIMQGLSKNAKFGVVKSELVYMGEFKNGDTVPRPVSPADAYQYTYAQTKFQFSWRWTTLNTAYTQPDKGLGQLGPMKAAITPSTGAVAVSIEYINDSNTMLTTHGRIAVFALCTRGSLIDTIPSTADNFAEIDQANFFPGETLRASRLVQLNENIREAAVSCEFADPTLYQHGDTVPVLVSAIDGYTYSRDEMDYFWEWADTSNQTGSNLRQAGFWGEVEPLGNVILKTWRLPPGGPYDLTQIYASILVTVIGIRASTHTTVTVAAANPASDSSSTVVDVNGPDKAPYSIAYDSGDNGVSPTASQKLLSHIIPGGEVAGVVLASSLPGSYAKALTAPVSSYVITIKKNGSSVGSINFAGAATTGTFTFSSSQTCVPGDVLDFIAPSGVDSIAGIYFTIAGKRS